MTNNTPSPLGALERSMGLETAGLSHSAAAASLTAMQIYWAYLIVKQLQKMAAKKGA